MATKDKVPFFATRPSRWASRSCRPTSTSPTTSSSSSTGTSASASMPSRGSATGGRGDQGGARGDGPFTRLLDFCERVDNRAVNKKAIEALIKCGAFGSTNERRARGCSWCSSRRRAPGRRLSRTPHRPGLDLRPGVGPRRRGGGRQWSGAAFAGPTHPPIPLTSSSSRRSCSLPRRSRSACSSPRIPSRMSRPALRAKVGLPSGGARGAQGQGLGDDRGDHHRGEEDPHPQRRLHDVRDALRPRASVEILVFGKTLAKYEGALVADSIVVVRGKVDHKDADTTCLVVQSIERFLPTEGDPGGAGPGRDAHGRPGGAQAAPRRGALPASIIGELKDLLSNFPGESEVVIELSTTVGHRRLKLGPSCAFRAPPVCTPSSTLSWARRSCLRRSRARARGGRRRLNRRRCRRRRRLGMEFGPSVGLRASAGF